MIYEKIQNLCIITNEKLLECPEIQEVVARHNLHIYLVKLLQAGADKTFSEEIRNIQRKMWKGMSHVNNTSLTYYETDAKYVLAAYQNGTSIQVVLGSKTKIAIRCYQFGTKLDIGYANELKAIIDEKAADFLIKRKEQEERKKRARLEKIELEAKALRDELGVN
jgi:hypothetical protein